MGVCSGCKAHQIVPASLGCGPGTRRTCDWEEGARSASVPRPSRVGAWPTSRQRGPSVTMAIRVFQPPQCQIYGGGREAVPKCDRCRKGAIYLLGESRALLSEGSRHLPVLPFSRVSESQRSVWPPVGWKRTWERMHGGHVCKLGKAVQAQPQLNRAGVTAVGPVNDYLLHVRLRKSEQGNHVRPDPVLIPVPIPCRPPPCSCVPALALPHCALTVPQGPGFDWRWKMRS